MSNNLPKNGSQLSQFVDRRHLGQEKATAEQMQQQATANLANTRLQLATQFLNTLLPLVTNIDENKGGLVGVAVDYADELLIRLGLAQRIETTEK